VPKTQDRLSLDLLLIPVTVVVPEAGNPDPSTDVVQFQLVNGGLPIRKRPDDDGWVNGYWITRESGTILAAISVGPGGSLTPAPGRWAIWVRVVDNPSVPVAAVDQLIIE